METKGVVDGKHDLWNTRTPGQHRKERSRLCMYVYYIVFTCFAEPPEIRNQSGMRQIPNARAKRYMEDAVSSTRKVICHWADIGGCGHQVHNDTPRFPFLCAAQEHHLHARTLEAVHDM